jgi:hypothetical protein
MAFLSFWLQDLRQLSTNREANFNLAFVVTREMVQKSQ